MKDPLLIPLAVLSFTAPSGAKDLSNAMAISFGATAVPLLSGVALIMAEQDIGNPAALGLVYSGLSFGPFAGALYYQDQPSYWVGTGINIGLSALNLGALYLFSQNLNGNGDDAETERMKIGLVGAAITGLGLVGNVFRLESVLRASETRYNRKWNIAPTYDPGRGAGYFGARLKWALN
jgi:hypothetical protein